MAETESVEASIREEMQPLVGRAYAFRKYVTKWIKPLEESNVGRFVTLPHETFGGDALRHCSETYMKDGFGGILADVALASTEIPSRLAERVVDFDRSWKESQKMTLMRLRGIKDECPALMESLRPLLEAAKRVDALLAKIKKEEKNMNKVNIFGKKKTDQTKLDQLKNETSEAVIEMDNLKDTVKADFQNFIGKEHQVTEMLCSLLDLQREHLQKTADMLDESLDVLRQSVRMNPHRMVYKMPLQHHLLATRKEIAVPIEVCCSIMYQMGTSTEGLLRIPGKASKIKAIVANLNFDEEIDWDLFTQCHSVGGALKQYLRDLPEPLLTFKLYDDWINATRQLRANPGGGVGVIEALLAKLPKDHFLNLRYLVKFLDSLVKNADQNKMTSDNLATVMGPNLLWPEPGRQVALDDIPYRNMIVEVLLDHHDRLFPAFSFQPTLLRPPPSPYPSSGDRRGSAAPWGVAPLEESVFGVKLEDHLSENRREIASVIEECCSVMTQQGLRREGLLYHSGNPARVRRLRTALNNRRAINWTDFVDDVLSIGDALKQYLRILPEPLMTFGLYDDWISAIQVAQASSGDASRAPIEKILRRLPEAHFRNLRYLVFFLGEAMRESSQPDNVATVMGANLLFRDPQADQSTKDVHGTVQQISALIKFLVENRLRLFPDFHFAPLDVLPGATRTPRHASNGEETSPASENSSGPAISTPDDDDDTILGAAEKLGPDARDIIRTMTQKKRKKRGKGARDQIHSGDIDVILSREKIEREEMTSASPPSPPGHYDTAL